MNDALVALNPSITEMDKLLDAGVFTLADLREFASFRIGRNGSKSRSGRHAQAWLDAHTQEGNPPVKAQPKATGAGSRGGNPQKYARTLYAETVSGVKAPDPAFWTAYKSQAAKDFAQGVTTHADAQAKVLTLA